MPTRKAANKRKAASDSPTSRTGTHKRQRASSSTRSSNGRREDGDDDQDQSDAQAEEDEEDDEDGDELEFAGEVNKQGEWVRGTLTYATSKRKHYEGLFKNGEKHGKGTLFFSDGSTLEGDFLDGDIHTEKAVYTKPDGSKIVGPCKDGVISGLVVEYDEEGVETFRGMYADSVRHGPGEVILPDGGRLVGDFVEGEFTGEAQKYVYPPGLAPVEASLRGSFEQGQMQRARFFLDDTPIDMPVGKCGRHGYTVQQLLAERASSSVPAASLKRKKPSASKSSAAANSKAIYYRFDESTATRISSDPMLPDPFEQLCVYVAPGTIPNSGEGLFARIPLPAGVIVTWYSGTRDKGYKAERRRWGENSNTIALIDDDPSQADVDIDVTAEYSTTDTYCASLAHKCNHAFGERQNAKYDMALHPRFGLIKSIRTTRPIQPEEELFVDYGYATNCQCDDPSHLLQHRTQGPNWYRQQFDEWNRERCNQLSAAAAASNSTRAPTGAKRNADASPSAASAASSSPRSGKRKPNRR